MTRAKKKGVGWQSRIVDQGEVDPAELKANPQNWRKHPEAQMKALAGVLAEVGFVQNVIVNRRTGRLVDGHARVAAALEQGAKKIPVVYVDLSEQEEEVVLASLDPLAGMATKDGRKLKDLLSTAEANSAALRAMLKRPQGPGAPRQQLPRAVIAYQLVFDDEEQQQRWFAFLRYLKGHQDGETIAARLDGFLSEAWSE
jgi:hypothetical protein